MKKSSLLYIAPLMLGAMALGACDDNFEQPPMITPESALKAYKNMTIEELKTLYWQSDRNYVSTVGVTEEGEHIIIGGRVSSCDASGNIYKSVIIQDETGALTVAINAYDLYQSYQYGQMVYIDVTDLKIGGYNSLMQLGGEGEYNGAPSMTFMDEDVAKAHIEVDGLANPALVDTTTVAIPDVMAAKASTEGLIKWQSRLVRIDGVSFEDAGQQFAPTANANRYVKDADGNRINIRCSSYADFKNNTIPGGTGSVVGILSYYGTDWQMLMIDSSSLIGFDPTDDPDTPVTPDDPVTPDEPTEGAIPDGAGTEASPYSVAQVVAMGANITAQADKYVKGYIIGYVPGKVLSEASFSVPATAATNILLSNAPGVTDPAKCIPVQLPAGDVRNDLNLMDNPGNLGKIVTLKGSLEKYFGTAGMKSTSWCSIEGGGSTPDTPAGDGSQIAAQAFKNDGQGAWTISDVTLPEGLTYVWKHSTSYGMVATAYANNTNHAADSWLISPVFDLTGVTNPYFTFRHAMNFFASLDAAKSEATVAVRVEGGDWKVLAFNLPSSLGWAFIDSGEISIADYAGKKVQIGFHYTSTAAKAGTWEVDNFVLYGTK